MSWVRRFAPTFAIDALLPAVTVLGAVAHPDKPRADLLREREAADVAAIVRQALDEGWTVCDQRTGQWRPARRDDIAVLVPARTSLPFLEDALDSAGIAYRAEASSLVYQAAEVRSLLAGARAIADTSDSLSLNSAKASSSSRSPLPKSPSLLRSINSCRRRSAAAAGARASLLQAPSR